LADLKRGVEAESRPWTEAGGGDVVLVVSLAGAERRRSVGMTVRPTGGGARAHRRGGPPVLAWESEIGWAVSISGWRQCYWSTGSRVGDSRGG
jgi:hypothetical protein